jgi:hypothetical protein
MVAFQVVCARLVEKAYANTIPGMEGPHNDQFSFSNQLKGGRGDVGPKHNSHRPPATTVPKRGYQAKATSHSVGERGMLQSQCKKRPRMLALNPGKDLYRILSQ